MFESHSEAEKTDSEYSAALTSGSCSSWRNDTARPRVKLPKDWRELIALLISNGVEFVVGVGGRAVGFHGYPRFTGGIDFFVRPRRKNAERLIPRA